MQREPGWMREGPGEMVLPASQRHFIPPPPPHPKTNTDVLELCFHRG